MGVFSVGVHMYVHVYMCRIWNWLQLTWSKLFCPACVFYYRHSDIEMYVPWCQNVTHYVHMSSNTGSCTWNIPTQSHECTLPYIRACLWRNCSWHFELIHSSDHQIYTICVTMHDCFLYLARSLNVSDTLTDTTSCFCVVRPDDC